MQTRLVIFGILLGCAAALRAQVAPAATGPAINGSFKYDLRYAEIGEYYQGGTGLTQEKAVLSGGLQYVSDSERKPLSLQFGAGYGWILSGNDFGAGAFENFLISQGFQQRDWSFTLSDNVSYLPESQIAGFTGQPGTGEPVTGTGTSPTPTETIFTAQTVLLNNTTKANYDHRLSTENTLNLSGMFETLNFPKGGGYNTQTLNSTAGISQRLDGRNTLSETYDFDHYSYSDTGTTISTNSGLFGYQRLWSRKLMTNVSLGPDWVSNSGGQPAGSTNQKLNSSIQLAVNALVNETLHHGTATLTYMQGTNSGGGYIYGGGMKRATLAYHLDFRNKASFELNGGWYRTAGLLTSGVINAKFGVAQISEPIGKNFALFGNYTGTAQGSSISVPNGVLGTFWQNFSAGIAYSPVAHHF